MKIIAIKVLDLAPGLLSREQGKSRSEGERELRKRQEVKGGRQTRRWAREKWDYKRQNQLDRGESILMEGEG